MGRFNRRGGAATAGAEIRATADVFVAEIQAKLGLSVTASATVTNTESFAVNCARRQPCRGTRGGGAGGAERKTVRSGVRAGA